MSMTLFPICRDQRTGEEYTDKAAATDEARYGWYANEAGDIEVELCPTDYYRGSNNSDDPDSVDVSGGARVCQDVPKIDPVTREILPDQFVFRAGQVIELTDAELELAHEQAIEEARNDAEPEFSYD